jgi:hypothetical protein
MTGTIKRLKRKKFIVPNNACTVRWPRPKIMQKKKVEMLGLAH